ncbi:MAG: hypothetical protein ACOCV2_07110 [Persicimonas sp.]
MRRTQLIVCATALLCAGMLFGCAGDDKRREKDKRDAEQKARAGYETYEEDGYLVKRYALDSDDKETLQLTKYFEEYKDPDDESVTKRRLRKKEVDLNSDGTVNLVRKYDKDGNIRTDRLDENLDGTFDLVKHYDDGELARKEVLGEDGEEVVEVRYYSDDTITRVEKDRDQDGEVDYWEYYERGRLDRIGRDQDGDGSADNWTRR